MSLGFFSARECFFFYFYFLSFFLWQCRGVYINRNKKNNKTQPKNDIFHLWLSIESQTHSFTCIIDKLFSFQSARLHATALLSFFSTMPLKFCRCIYGYSLYFTCSIVDFIFSISISIIQYNIKHSIYFWNFSYCLLLSFIIILYKMDIYAFDFLYTFAAFNHFSYSYCLCTYLHLVLNALMYVNIF